MRLGIMQPYFFPYIGYFSLMHYADKFILLDTVQYDRKGWMNRNRILNPSRGWQYIRAGVKKPPFHSLIQDVMIEQNDDWKNMILRQLEHYKNVAPYYIQTIDLIQNALSKVHNTLTSLNNNVLKTVRDYLGIDCSIQVFSEMGLDIGKVKHAGQWALRISQACNAKEYVNPSGGRNIFKTSEFYQAGIKLTFLQHRLPEYDQKRGLFEPGLSIIDVLMFNSKDKVSAQLGEYDLN